MHGCEKIYVESIARANFGKSRTERANTINIGGNKMTIGERLKQLRKKHDISQYVLADFLNTKRSVVYTWECGSSHPSWKLILRLCDVFRMTPSELLEGVTE